MIRVIKADAFEHFEEYDVVLLGCSIYCMIESGFGGKLKNIYPVIQECDDKTPYADQRKLGTTLTISETYPAFALLYVCRYPLQGRTTVDYDAVEKCLTIANVEFKGKKVMATIIGAGRFDGQGDKERCLEIIERCCTNLDVDVYDYEQLTMREERRLEYQKNANLKKQQKDGD